MPRGVSSISDNSLWLAALEGLEAQKKRIAEQIGQVQALLGRRAGRAPAAAAANPPARKRRQLSAAARRRIAAAQRRRWAEFRKKAESKS